MKPWRADLAMHVAALNPAYIDAGGVPAAVLDKEREILAEQTRREKKPPEIIAKMVQGRLRKYLAEITLIASRSSRTPTPRSRSCSKKPAPPSCNRALRSGRRHREETGRFRERGHGAGKGAEAKARR